MAAGQKELQDFARANGMDFFYDKLEIIQGWEGQPKGLLQVLGNEGLLLIQTRYSLLILLTVKKIQ